MTCFGATLLMLPVSYGAAFSISDLPPLIQKYSIFSVDELIHRLPETLKSQPVWVYRTRSLLTATPELPRGILADPEARFILSFTGAGDAQNKERVEIMQFNSAERKFELYVLQFPQGAISKKNPQECLGCHRADPRPVWDPFPHWLGIYGSEMDAVLSTSSFEGAEFKSFVDAAPQLMAYRHVKPQLAADNARFGFAINRLNSQRIARKISEAVGTPRSPWLKYSLLAAWYCEEDDFVKKALPALKARGANSKGFGDIFKSTREAVFNYQNFRLNRHVEFTGQSPQTSKIRDLIAAKNPIERTETLGRVRYLMETLAQQSIEDWSTALNRATYSFEDGMGGAANLAGAAWTELLDPAIDQDLEQAQQGDELCKLLVSKINSK
jgi:hypothetical protein